MMKFIINNLNELLITGSCSVLGTEFKSILNEVFGWIQIATPCLVILLCQTNFKIIYSSSFSSKSF